MSAVLPDRGAMNVPEAAAAWCAIGWQVVPMGPDKRPLCKWKGAASETPAQALARFAGLPRGTGLAIALPAGVMVLDVDHRPARGWDGALILAALAARFGLPDAPMTATPSGRRHVWLALPDGARVRNSTSRASPLAMDGVDVRTAGGLIIVPPTERKGVAYVWQHWQAELPLAPSALVDALQPGTRAVPAVAPSPFHGGPITPYAEAIIRRELESVARCGRGGRNDALFRATARLANLHAGGALPDVRALLEDAASRSGLVRDDGWLSVRATIASSWRSGLATPRTLPTGGR